MHFLFIEYAMRVFVFIWKEEELFLTACRHFDALADLSEVKRVSSRAFEAALRVHNPQIFVFDSTNLRLPHNDAKHNFQTVITISFHSPH